MAASTPNTVLLKGDPLAVEGVAAVSQAIKPGMLLERHTDGTFRKHSVGGGNAVPMFAREFEIAGGGIDAVYDDGDRVLGYIGRKGDEFYAFLAAGQDVTLGEYLESNGAGALRAIDTTGAAIVRALEAKDNDPGSGGAAVRIKVEVV